VREVARDMLEMEQTMSESQPVESWTIPFIVIMWTNICVGFIMMLVVFMMH
jgi:hypothetical protein